MLKLASLGTFYAKYETSGTKNVIFWNLSCKKNVSGVESVISERLGFKRSFSELRGLFCNLFRDLICKLICL